MTDEPQGTGSEAGRTRTLVVAIDAVKAGNTERVRIEIDAFPELVRMRGGHGITLLHVAAEHDRVAITRFLLDRGADLEAEADWGYTPFEWAAAMASDGVAALLLQAGAHRLNLWTAAALGMLDTVRDCFDDGRLRPGSGRSPRPGADLTGWPEDAPYRTGDELGDAFHIAARNGRREVAAFLLERGANVDAAGYFGATALHWAAVAGREEIVRWLVDVGADPRRRDPKFDATPSGWAREGDHYGLALFLATKEGSG